MEVVRFVGNRACVDEAYKEAVSSRSRQVLDPLPKGGNILVTFRVNDRPMQITPDAATRDLMDLAISAYIVDELVAREKAPDGWSRDFNFLMPVRNPPVWEACTEKLRRTLYHLSGDLSSFTWVERSTMPSLGRHRRTVPQRVDAVCLFSGGIDSLLGAHRLLSEGKKVLLVGHQADGTTAHAQKELARALQLRFPGRAALVQCRVSRSSIEGPRFALPEKVEETHRPRSFLFLCLAVAVANASKAKDIYIPENGLIALNSPLQVSRVGSLSTRTAHPVFLMNFLDLVKCLGVYDGAIKNPFIYESKTDMIRGLDPQLKGLVRGSISCARPSRYKQMKVHHCGYCVPCLYRRVAMMEADLDAPADYAFDVFTSLAGLSEHTQADFRALVGFARKIVAAKPLARDMLVLAHGSFRPEVGGILGPAATGDYSPWSSMMARWAEDFLAKVLKNSSAETLRIVGLRQSRVSV